jgi:hypothetical protein
VREDDDDKALGQGGWGVDGRGLGITGRGSGFALTCAYRELLFGGLNTPLDLRDWRPKPILGCGIGREDERLADRSSRGGAIDDEA